MTTPNDTTTTCEDCLGGYMCSPCERESSARAMERYIAAGALRFTVGQYVRLDGESALRNLVAEHCERCADWAANLSGPIIEFEGRSPLEEDGFVGPFVVVDFGSIDCPYGYMGPTVCVQDELVALDINQEGN